MKFLKNFFSIVIFLGVGVIVVTVVYFEAVLRVGSSQIKSDLRTLIRQVKKPSHIEECRGGASGLPVLGYQLRFTDSRAYVLEAVCQSSSKGPFEIKAQKLPWGIVKVPGYSGFLLKTDKSEESAKVVLGLVKLPVGWTRFREVVWEDGEVYEKEAKMVADDYGTSPAETSCAAWGYHCCQSNLQEGSGGSQTSFVTDCSKRCFETCLNLPAILLFTTDPQLDPETRQVFIPRDQVVIFSYSVDDTDGSVVEARIDFSDGEEFRGFNIVDTVSHRFSCPIARCVYQVRLSAIDNDGLESAETRVSQIEVVVK